MTKKGPARLIDIAADVGISRSAVARVILGTGAGNIRVSEASAKKIRASAKRLKYQPNRAAQQLKGKGTRTIAAVAVDSAPPVVMDRICAMERRAWELGYELVLCRTPHLNADKVDDFLARLRSCNVEGLVVLDRISKSEDNTHPNRRFDDFTSVFHGYTLSGSPEEHGVLPDVYAGTRLATSHLIEKGYDRIGLSLIGVRGKRIAAWGDELKEAGIKSRKADFYAVEIYGNAAQKLSYEVAEKIVDKLVIKQKLNALILENDYWAARILQVLHDRKIRVPEDVALVGYNNLDFTEFTSPPITTIDEDNEAIGRALVDQLLGKLKGTLEPDDAPIINIAPKLIVREST